ncbi:porphobilinogen synthase [Caldanaerobacter sp.]|uniref:porphobilinogen synthase n=1 Tax=Caldanaerobacter sp. TaxID=2930036 RepID=UPI003C76BAB0
MKLVKRPRRLRVSQNIRDMVRETFLCVKDLIYPLFVVEGERVKAEVRSMPGVYHFSVDLLIEEIKEVKDLGIPAVLLFGVTSQKDEFGTYAYKEDGIVQRAVRAIKEKINDVAVITDVCMCGYTSHGHCGIVEDGEIVNDKTLDYIAKIALSHVEAGADIVAPSDMMDGRVKAIRDLLDERGYVNTPIMAYSAKYASSFYGPFREAADSAPRFGDRKTYQMDYGNSDEALKEVELDIEEGADIVMVKPALSYLDIIRRVKDSFKVPVAAYSVSGEYSMIKAAAKMGWLDEKAVVMEIMTSIKRAGADMIITYFAKDVAKWLSTR